MKRTRLRKHLVAAQALLLSASLCAQQTPAPAQQPPAKPQTSAVGQEQSKTVLFQGTPVHLQLMQQVSSANAKVGDAVNFDTVDDVRLGDTLVIPKGSHALGKVTTVVQKRHMGRPGKLDMSIDFVRLPSGEKLALSGSPAETGKGHQGRMAGAMVATSIVVWPAAPFFLFMHGKDITIPTGQAVTVYTAEDYDTTKAKGANAPSAAPAVPATSTTPANPAPAAPASSPAPPATSADSGTAH